MPAITIGKLIAPRVHPQRWCNNGMVVDYALEGRLRASLNAVAKWRGKCLFRSPGKLLAPAASGVSSRNRWRARGHTGPLTEYLAVVMTMTLPGTGVPTFNLFGRCVITPAGGAALDPVDFYYGNTLSTASGDVPAHHSHALFLVPVNPDTTYEFAFSDHGVVGGVGVGVCSRLVSAEIHELKLPAHTLNGYVEPGVAVGLPIYDSHRDTAFALARDLWKQGGATCVNIGTETDSEVRTRTSATPVNFASNASDFTGFKLDMRNRNRRSKTTVPMVLAAYGKMASGTGTLRLMNVAGAVATVSINANTLAWYTTTADVDADEDHYWFDYAGDGTNQVDVYAVSLYEHDAS